jgi:hypothetical protein
MSPLPAHGARCSWTGAAEEAKLKDLRSAHAARFCEPAPHAALAKQLYLRTVLKNLDRTDEDE